MQCVADCDTHHPKTFEQPVLQTLQMFIGESGCWLVVFASFLFNRFVRSSRTADETEYTPVARRDSSDLEDELDVASDDMDDDVAHGNLTASQTLVDPTNIPTKPFADAEIIEHEREPLTGWRITILALPAICDILGTTLMNAGLLFVAASIYQMTRGALVLFVGLFSVIFLRRHLGGWKWASLFIVVAGVALVGLAGVLEKGVPSLPGDTQPNPDVHDSLIRSYARAAISSLETHTPAETILGITMIAGAQIFTASQFVLEESIMERYSMDPIQVVGWEGVFGFLVTLLATGILHLVVGRTPAGKGGYFDAREGFHEMFTNRTIAVTSLLIMVSIGYVPISPPSIPQCQVEVLLTRYNTAVSTSSASPLRAKSPPQPAAQSTRAARCSSGSSRWAWAGRRSSGCRS
jgi:drug/metabolite transporter (DMT)-like permease